MGKIWDLLFGKKPPLPPVDVVAMHEARTAGMCTLAPQVEAWRNWLVVHTSEVEEEQKAVLADIERLNKTKRGFEELRGTMSKHKKIIGDTHKTLKNLLDSFNLQSDPVSEDVIGLHAKALTELQASQRESLIKVSKVLEDETESMSSREENLHAHLESVEEKMERLNQTRKILDAEKEVTEAFKETIVAFIVSKFAPPKS